MAPGGYGLLRDYVPGEEKGRGVALHELREGKVVGELRENIHRVRGGGEPGELAVFVRYTVVRDGGWSGPRLWTDYGVLLGLFYGHKA